MGVQRHYKKCPTKRSCRKAKSFYKFFTKNPKPIFHDKKNKHNTMFLGISRLGEFKNTIKISKKTNPALVLVWPLTHPPTTGVTGFVLGGPLALAVVNVRRSKCVPLSKCAHVTSLQLAVCAV
jgi:hypothetical protein